MKKSIKVLVFVFCMSFGINVFGAQLVEPVYIGHLYHTGPDFSQVELRNRVLVYLPGAVWNSGTCETNYVVIPENDHEMTAMILATYFAGQKLFVGTYGIKVWNDRCQISYAHPVK